MAQYHCQVRSPISRKKGQSVVAKAAYNARETLRDERTGENKNYSRNHDEVLFSGIFIDPTRQAPAWTKDRAALWNAASSAEKRKDAREAQEIIVGLPHELTDKQREFMLKDFVRENITRGTGRIADVNIHRPPARGDERNYHAHILMTLREIGPEGFGKRLPEMTPEHIVQLRTKWAERGARELEKAGFALEADRWAVGHKPLEAQRQAAMQRGDRAWADELRKQATKHLGPGATAMERKGQETERGDRERRGRASEMELAQLERELAFVQQQILAVRREPGVVKAGGMRFGDRLLNQAATDAMRDQRQQHGQMEGSAIAFRDALDKRRLSMARVTPEEAARSQRERHFAKQLGRTAMAFKPGEIVIVQEPRPGQNAAPRAYKGRPRESGRLCPLSATTDESATRA